jgi:NAD(P)-dependent dehydrogenase (short-subunit alcohol dehydrogenase family)
MAERLAGLNPSLVVFTGRNEARGASIVQRLREQHPKVRVEFLKMDLASLKDVQASTATLAAMLGDRLDLLICNAGIMAVPPGLSPDGYEIQWATNHLGHALLIKHLRSTLTTTAEAHGDARVVVLTSEGLMLAPDGGIIFKDLKTTQDYGFGAKWRRYGQSKLANVLYTQQLAERYPQVSFVAIHPGVVGTDLVSSLGFLDRMFVYATSKLMKPEDGCKSPLWGATVPRSSFTNGGYYQPIGEVGKPTKWTQDKKLGDELWTWTESALQEFK